MHRSRILQSLQAIVIISLIAAAAPAYGLLTMNDVQTVSAAPVSQTDANKVFLPILSNYYPLKTVFGIEMSSINDSGGLQQVADADASWIRRNGLLWSSAEPVEDQIAWDSPDILALDQQLINASQRGIPVILVVRRTPLWAQAIQGYYCGPILESKLDKFAEFMYQAVRRYSQPPYNVKYWQIWNEPEAYPQDVAPDTGYGCWGDPGDPLAGGGYYADMLQKVYPKIKQADSSAKVLLGGLLLACNPEFQNICASPTLSFLQGILDHHGANDGKNFFDIVAFHSYDYYYGNFGEYGNASWKSQWDTTGPALTEKVKFLRGVLAQYDATDKPIMNTEAALLCGSSGTEPACLTSDYETTKAYYVPQLFADTIADGLEAGIWYSVFGWRGSGLMDYNLNTYPAYDAFKFARSELQDVQFIRHLDEYTDLFGYVMLRFDKRIIWLVRSKNHDDHEIQLPGTPSAIWDVFGNPVPVTGTTLTVTLKPLYIEW